MVGAQVTNRPQHPRDHNIGLQYPSSSPGTRVDNIAQVRGVAVAALDLIQHPGEEGECRGSGPRMQMPTLGLNGTDESRLPNWGLCGLPSNFRLRACRRRFNVRLHPHRHERVLPRSGIELHRSYADSTD